MEELSVLRALGVPLGQIEASPVGRFSGFCSAVSNIKVESVETAKGFLLGFIL